MPAYSLDGSDEPRLRIRKSLEETLGMEEAAYLIEGRPPTGWDALVTKDYLDTRFALSKEYLDLRLEERTRAELDQVRIEFRDQTTRMIKWFVPTVFTGMVSSALIAGAFAVLA